MFTIFVYFTGGKTPLIERCDLAGAFATALRFRLNCSLIKLYNHSTQEHIHLVDNSPRPAR